MKPQEYPRSTMNVKDVTDLLVRENNLIVENVQLRIENAAIKATQAKVSADYAACFAENERLRVALELAHRWMLEASDIGLLGTPERNLYVDAMNMGRAALAATKG